MRGGRGATLMHPCHCPLSYSLHCPWTSIVIVVVCHHWGHPSSLPCRIIVVCLSPLSSLPCCVIVVHLSPLSLCGHCCVLLSMPNVAEGEGVTWQLVSVMLAAHAPLTQQVLITIVVDVCTCAKVDVMAMWVLC